jgi:hypothetical protein
VHVLEQAARNSSRPPGTQAGRQELKQPASSTERPEFENRNLETSGAMITRRRTRGAVASPRPPQDRTELHDAAFRFLDLPRTVREQVYKLLFVSEDPVELEFASICQNPYLVKASPAPGLLRTSQHVHEEATDTKYGKNDFRFSHNQKHMKDWVEKIV